MPILKAEDFDHVATPAALDEILATGYAPDGEPGTPEHATNVADALEFAQGDVFHTPWDEPTTDPSTLAAHAATGANVSSLQAAAGYAAEVMQALAKDPELLRKVAEAVDANRPGRAP